MAPVIHCSAGNIRLFHGTSFIARNDIHLTKYNASRKYARLTCCRRFPSPQSSLGLFQISRSGSGSKYRSEIQTVVAVGTDVTVEELSPAVSGDKADETLESPPKPVETTEAPLAGSAVNTAPRIKRARPGRKSDMPPVKDEELVAGASFTGKVRSIQPFGAFVDFGAFTDGLVHVSRISDGYVKDIGAVVSIGQEVKVRIVEANMESRRISLTMRDGDDTSKPQQRPDVSSSGSSDKPRPARSNAGRPNQKRGDVQKSKFVKGQVLDGTVKKLTRSGAFVSLPEGEEGFLPVSEESEGFDSILGNSSLTVGQEVNVRVLRLTRGVTLTMKKEEDVAGLNKQLNQGVVHVATNPFELAFRKNKDIAAFLEEQKKSQKVSENLSTPETSDPKDVGDALKLDGSTAETGKGQINVSSVSPTLVGDEETTPDELNEETTVDSVSGEPVSNEEEPTSSSVLNANAIPEIIPEEGDDSETVIKSSSDSVSDELPLPTEAKETDVTTTTEPELVSESPSTEKIETPSIEEVATAEETNVDTQSSGDISDQVLSSEGVPTEEVASSQPDDILVRDTVVAETPQLVETEKSESDSNDILVRDTVVAETPQLVETEKSESDSKDEIANASETGSSDQGGETKATISPSLVKQLREESGAGMMDCKKALTETEGDIVKAQELLRKKGLASADKKASRATAEGRIGAYIHDNRIGVLIEVNCETDFVARGEIFKELVDDLAMQVAACPQVRYLTTEDVPEEFVKKEREIEMQKEDLLTKPEQIRSKIVDGRIKKRLEEFALLEQPYIKNDKIVVKDFVKQTIATIGENINVKRFVRYNLGEGLEKKSQDFAAEVAAQTAAKPSSAAAPPKEQPAEVKVEKAQTVTVSAALVKQLRDETGAGMMDCKKALTETEGDLGKAQEYLRKKGLSSADKKSSRLAVEGRISSYIHDSRIGVLIEVNSETDFVARNEKFKEMVDNLAMQVVACPQVEYVSVEDIPESIVRKEKELEMEREDLKSKPEPIREKIVQGRISKRLGELALLEQAFIKDDSVTVKDLVKQTVAALGENMRVRRFVRFTLGEN